MTAHERIADELRRRVLAGVYAPGERLPALWRIADTFGVSEPVVGSAVRDLRRAGLLRSVPGVGVWVADQITDTARMRTLLESVRCSTTGESVVWGADARDDTGADALVLFPATWIHRLIDENESLRRRLIGARTDAIGEDG